MNIPNRRYVLGFCMTFTGVLLIQKTSPPQWKGKANGIGGKIIDNEAPVKAMVREFKEEAGILTEPHQWKVLIEVKGRPCEMNNYSHNWTMPVFWTIKHGLFSDYTYETEEGKVSVYTELPNNLDRTAQWLYLLLQDYLEKGVEILI